MRPDRLHVAVRSRGILECLDLATLFCGRRPLAVLVAAALGAAPWIVVNQLLFAGADGDHLLLPAAWVLGMEMPWAAAPLVLCLGQAMFADRVSWRFAARSLAGALPAMILFQVLLRGACLGLVVLAPVVVIGMYFLDPIILLERPRLSQVWSRRSAMNRRSLGHVMSLVAVELALLAGGWFLGLEVVDAVVATWRGVGPGDADVMGGPVARLFSWQSQVAFWAAHAFLVVFRFFAYLDARIRREGWDVELKFRSAATTAGLDRRGRGTERAAAVVGLALLATLAAAVEVRAADDARAALQRQRFPWYDAAADDYRPLVDVRRPPLALPPPPRVAPVADWSGFGLDRGVQVALLIAAIAVVAWVLVRHGLPDLAPPPGKTPQPVAAVLGAEQLEALPEAARSHDGDLLAEASAHAARGDFAGAMVFFHAWLLVRLHARGALELARGKTNGRYVAEVRAAAPLLAPTFARSTRLFEDAFFGRLPVAAADFAAVWESRGGLVDPPPAQEPAHGQSR